MPAVLGQSTSFALNGPPFTSMANQQNAATNRGDRASACDEVACVKTALGFNKKKPHPTAARLSGFRPRRATKARPGPSPPPARQPFSAIRQSAIVRFSDENEMPIFFTAFPVKSYFSA